MFRDMMARPGSAAATITVIADRLIDEIDPVAEDGFWRAAYPDARYYDPKHGYWEFAPAYRLGYEGRQRYRCSFESAEAWLRSDWENQWGVSSLGWSTAKLAVRDAWDRIERLSQRTIGRDGL